MEVNVVGGAGLQVGLRGTNSASPIFPTSTENHVLDG